MTRGTITTSDRTTTRHHAGGGKVPTVLDHTDIHVDGECVHTITWNSALLRRLEANGWSRADYANRIASRYTA